MSLALARKYRPRNFASVAVQSHVSNTLKGAIARGRVAHGYLLCGPRGTGKTTLARVLAMALNCDTLADERHRVAAGGSAGAPQSGLDAGEPCGVCESCTRIWSGSASMDVVEIDAASNRGVDDARDLRERAMYAPSGDDRYKVYIVDEAHMLTREAWNALLKILEEPPPRVVFVFATTEPQKIAQSAAPVLSRLQRFDLKRIGPAEIRDRLAAVLDAEGVSYDDDALGIIARAADGGLRDALSLTDQVLSLGESANVTPDRVREALGLVAEDEYLALLDLVAERRAGDVFGAVGRLADQGVDFGALLTGLADTLRAQLAIVLGGAPQGISERTRLALEERRERLSSADLLRMLNALVEIEPRFRKSGQQQLLLETLLVRFALVDRSVSLEELLRGFGEGGGSGGAGRPASGGASRPPNAPSSSPPGAYGASGASTRDAAPMNRGAGSSPSASSASSAPAASAAPASPTARMGAFAATSIASETSAGAAVAHDSAGALAATLVAPPARATRVAPSPAPASPPAPAAPPATFARGAMLDLNTVVERWAEVSEVVRRNGRGFLATALDAALPVSITAAGAITLELEEANETFAKAIEAAREEILAAVRDVFGGGERITLRPIEGAARGEPLQRITAESVKTDTVAMLRRRDAVLGAAVDALDLDLVE